MRREACSNRNAEMASFSVVTLGNMDPFFCDFFLYSSERNNRIIRFPDCQHSFDSPFLDRMKIPLKKSTRFPLMTPTRLLRAL